MKIHLPNSAHLQNIEGFIRRCSSDNADIFRISGHRKYIHAHPFALALAACAGVAAQQRRAKTVGSIPNVPSVPYLIRMKLFDYLDVPAPREIEEHEESGRFVPLTRIQSSEDLRSTITNLVPLLHTNPAVADPIRYVISELGRNVLEHSRSSVGGFVCAQYFRNKKRIAIGMADAGIGIHKAIRVSHNAPTEAQAFRLALTPGISGSTPKIGGNETNAGAGLFFIRSIAKTSGNFFVLYSGTTEYKLLRKQTQPNAIHSDPLLEGHRVVNNLPRWRGTAIGIDINVDETSEFASLLDVIRKSYSIGLRSKKRSFFRKIRFT